MFETNEQKNREPHLGHSSRLVDYAKDRNIQENAEGFFCRFTFGQFFALLVLEVFTIFFVFYLGARYGPRFLGLDKGGPVVVGEANSAAAVSPAVSAANAAKVTTTDDPEVAAMADELISKAKTPELKERLASMLKRPAEDANKVISAPLQQAAVPQPQLESAEEVSLPPASQQPLSAATQNPVAPQVESGAVLMKSAENARYALQVGSYQLMSEANTAVEKWKDKGYPAYLMIADIPDRGRWYRVRIGGFSSREEAKKYQTEIKTQDAAETIIVMNEQ